MFFEKMDFNINFSEILLFNPKYKTCEGFTSEDFINGLPIVLPL